MTRIQLFLIILLLFFTGFAASSQTKTPNQILNKVYAKTQKAKDYSVQANIKVDLPFVRMLPIEAKIYFKQKDKFKVESKSIAIVPRQGFDQVSKMLVDTSSFTAMIQGRENLGVIPATILTIIPLSDTSDLILARVWVDEKSDLVLKSQLTTKTNGTILTEYVYGTQIAYGLPDQLIFTVDVKKFKIPKGVTADINNKADTDPKKDPKKGKIYIKLSNYQVNKGVPDSVFKK
ncbi:MAG: hypothetical protein M3R27_16735 [Bacteroidota bacterium]|nr:hypothetical protein [Bacteroidota bacterium]